jgi:hypothetical protein
MIVIMGKVRRSPVTSGVHTQKVSALDFQL